MQKNSKINTAEIHLRQAKKLITEAGIGGISNPFEWCLNDLYVAELHLDCAIKCLNPVVERVSLSDYT